MLMYGIYQAIVAGSPLIPRRLQHSVAVRLADLYYLGSRRDREAVLANLRVIHGSAVPESLLRREARGTFRGFGMYLAEFFGYRRFGPEYLAAHVSVQGRAHLDSALAQGRGALLVSGHYSNWELGASMIGHLGYPILIVAQMHRDARVNELFVSMRAKHGVTVAHSDQGARAALRGLRDNRPVAILGDRLTGGPTVPVTFFGRAVVLPQGPWRLSLATGAPILPTFVNRQNNGEFTLEIGTPLNSAPSNARADRVAALAQVWASQLETRVRLDPSQWAVFYPFWERQAAQDRSSTTERIRTDQACPVQPARSPAEAGT